MYWIFAILLATFLNSTFFQPYFLLNHLEFLLNWTTVPSISLRYLKLSGMNCLRCAPSFFLYKLVTMPIHQFLLPSIIKRLKVSAIETRSCLLSCFFPFLWLSAPSIPPKFFSVRLPFEILVGEQQWKTNHKVLNIEYKRRKY